MAYLYPPQQVDVVVGASPANLTATPYDQIVLVDVVPCVINLPAIGSPPLGKITVKDRTGAATSGAAITITPNGVQTVESGTPSLAIKSGFASFVLSGSGTKWSIL